MKYVQPIGGAVNDPYVDANPGTGTEGSAVPAAAIEHPMREILAVITAAGIAPSEANLSQLLAALRSAGVFQTPSQFDNTTKTATTAFMQRALGNYQTGAGIAAPATLTPAQAGGVYMFSSAGTFTLPTLASTPAGTSYQLVNYSGGPCTVQRQGADPLFASGASVASFVIAAGDTATVVNLGSVNVWSCINGNANLAGSPLFAASLAPNGYQKYPSGKIEQWGIVSAAAAIGNTAVTFPIAFPNACQKVVLGLQLNAGTYYPCGTNSKSLAAFNLYNPQASAQTYDWFAIGN